MPEFVIQTLVCVSMQELRAQNIFQFQFLMQYSEYEVFTITFYYWVLFSTILLYFLPLLLCPTEDHIQSGKISFGRPKIPKLQRRKFDHFLTFW